MTVAMRVVWLDWVVMAQLWGGLAVLAWGLLRRRR